MTKDIQINLSYAMIVRLVRQLPLPLEQELTVQINRILDLLMYCEACSTE